MPYINHVAKNIARLRQAQNFTQRQLAKLVGISVNDLNTIENGTSGAVDDKILTNIAQELGTSPCQLCDAYMVFLTDWEFKPYMTHRFQKAT